MINFEFPPIGGGTATANYFVLREMAKFAELEIDMVTSKAEKGNEITDFSENITLHRLGIRKSNLHHWTAFEMVEWFVKTYFYTRKLMQKKDYHLCFCWNGWPNGILGYLFRRRQPYLIALRGHDVPGYEIRFRMLEKLFLKRFSKHIWEKAKFVTANSDMLADMARNTSSVPIHIIYNGVNTVQFFPAEEKIVGNPIRLISTGRLGQRKGYLYLIRALRKISGFKLIIIGDGVEKETLMKEAEGLDVEFRGYVPHSELNVHLQEADMYISTSLVEGMSNSTLEAMAAGLPIITTDVGGTKELINGNGTIIERTEDVEAIVDALKGYVGQTDKILEEGRVSRQIAESMSWRNTALKYRDLMNSGKTESQ
jgi:glycosyltransferase involved in cell wall biosynthesis